MKTHSQECFISVIINDTLQSDVTEKKTFTEIYLLKEIGYFFFDFVGSASALLIDST